MDVKLAIEATIFLIDPASEGRRFIVEEDAAIFDCGLRLGVAAGCDVEGIAVGNSHVGPPVPGRDADLFGEIVDAKDCAALVASGNDKCALYAGQWRIDDSGDGRLPLACDACYVQFASADEVVDQRTFADRANDDYVGNGSRRQ